MHWFSRDPYTHTLFKRIGACGVLIGVDFWRAPVVASAHVSICRERLGPVAVWTTPSEDGDEQEGEEERTEWGRAGRSVGGTTCSRMCFQG